MLKILFIINISAIAFLFLFSYWNNSPTNYLRETRIENYKITYLQLQKRTDSLQSLLSTFLIPNDNRYRSILEMDSIPLNIRYAGTGGIDPNAKQKFKMSDKLFPVLFNKIEAYKRQLQIQSESYAAIQKHALDNKNKLDHYPAIMPVKSDHEISISSFFGQRADPFTTGPRQHEGLDIEGNKGTNIYAVANGTVSFTKHSRGGYGNEIVINHGYGYSTRYAHLSKILISDGQVLKRGELIGLMGSTGRSTGCHLHYEVRLFNRAINPLHFFNDDVTSAEFEEMIKNSEKN